MGLFEELNLSGLVSVQTNYLQSNLSKAATLRTEKSGRCTEVAVVRR